MKDKLRALGSALESRKLRSECANAPPTLEAGQRRPPTSVAEALKKTLQMEGLSTEGRTARQSNAGITAGDTAHLGAAVDEACPDNRIPAIHSLFPKALPKIRYFSPTQARTVEIPRPRGSENTLSPSTTPA